MQHGSAMPGKQFDDDPKMEFLIASLASNIVSHIHSGISCKYLGKLLLAMR